VQKPINEKKYHKVKKVFEVKCYIAELNYSG
jgi:hypothetical protein